jgi:metal-dependent amidase/aminoacylase/carboxypeptidase family protein
MKQINPQQEKILQTIDSASDSILSISHHIHAHPELGYEEVLASVLPSEPKNSALTLNVDTQVFQPPSAPAGVTAADLVAFLAEYGALPDLGHVGIM